MTMVRVKVRLTHSERCGRIKYTLQSLISHLSPLLYSRVTPLTSYLPGCAQLPFAAKTAHGRPKYVIR